jgi:HEAT repeat protein
VESLKGFQPLLQGGEPLSLAVRREGFLLDEQPVAKTHQVLGQLATFCFARRIQHLTILPDLSAGDLHRFVHCLTIDPHEIHSRGGIQAVLEQARVMSVWVNETDLGVILARRQKLAELPPESDAAEAPGETGPRARLTPVQKQALDLERLIKQLEQERDDQRFRYQLQELIPLLRLNLLAENRLLVLRGMVMLCKNAAGQKCSDARRAYALNALGQLATDEMTDYLTGFLFAREGNEKVRTALSEVLVFLGDKIVRRLMTLLAEESVAGNRKQLADILVRIGTAAIPVLQEHLFDERWYVVRNAVVILGEIRSEETLLHLTPLLEHREVRVRRETIRALAKIGGQRALAILLQVAESNDQELRRQALLSLGAIRAAGATPTLLKLLEQSDWSRRTLDIKKDAIRALGEIGATAAVPALTAILGKRRWLRRALNDELRIAAAAALGDIGEGHTRPALEKATQDRNPEVARSAAKALAQLEKEVT